MRAMEYQAHDERVVVLRRMHKRVGQAPFNSPSVFNFYLPEYQPYGRCHFAFRYGISIDSPMFEDVNMPTGVRRFRYVTLLFLDLRMPSTPVHLTCYSVVKVR